MSSIIKLGRKTFLQELLKLLYAEQFKLSFAKFTASFWSNLVALDIFLGFVDA